MGDPSSMILLPNRKESLKSCRARLQSEMALNLVIGIFTKEQKLAALCGCIAWNPLEAITSPPSDPNKNAVTYINFLSPVLFAHHYFHDPSPYFAMLRQRATPSQIVKGGPLAVAFNYRGLNLASLVHRLLFQHIYKLGYRLEVGWSNNPNSALGMLRSGFDVLPEISYHRTNFMFKGKKPFEAHGTSFGEYPQYTNIYLCTVGIIEDLIFLKTKKKIRNNFRGMILF